MIMNMTLTHDYDSNSSYERRRTHLDKVTNSQKRGDGNTPRSCERVHRCILPATSAQGFLPKALLNTVGTVDS